MSHSKINRYFLLIFLIFISFSTTEKISYTSNAFKESIEQINNPDQGFYRPILVIMTPDSFDHDDKTPDQVYHLSCDISEFSGAVNSEGVDKKITQNALDGLDNYLSEIKKQNKNAVIRFGYDPRYEGTADKEASLEMIEIHIKQLSEILNKHVDILTGIQAGLLGPWAEMHTSKIATEENKALVFKWWLENTNKIPVLARTPKAMFQYFGKTLDEMEKYEIKSTDEGYYLGLFNDCYFSTDIDYLTYVFDRKRETEWLATQNEHLPFGGETCGLTYMSNLETCIPEMFLLGLSYLNIEYHTGVLDKWRKLKYNDTLGSEILYYNMSALDFIERHLGYRLLIKSVNVNYEKYGSYEMKIKMRNVGFGNLCKTKKIDIIYTDMKNKEIYRKNIGNYKGEMTIEIKDKFLSSDENSEYKVYLSIYGSIENEVVYYPIQFANVDIYDDNLKGHLLFLVKKGEVIEP